MTIPRVQATRYTVNLVPEDAAPDYYVFEIQVEYRGKGQWAVKDGPWCLGADGEWEYEAIPSSRTDEWLATHRFPEQEALRLAVEAAPGKTVNGMTAAQALARYEARKDPR